jgi:hypothetical protein
MNKLFLILFIGVLFSCTSNDDTNIEIEQDNIEIEEEEEASIIGSWKIISLASNGTEELQEELDHFDMCYWIEEFTQTTIIDTDFSGTDCTTETIEDTQPYTINGTNLSYTTKDQVLVSLEILELTSTTLKLEDSYVEEEEIFSEIYTYTRQ